MVAKVVELNNNIVGVVEGEFYYELSVDKFNFTPRVSDKVRLFKDSEGKITKGILCTDLEDENAEKGKALSILSIIFGALGFFPLGIPSSIASFVMSIIGLCSKTKFKNRFKVGLGLSIGALALWVAIILYRLQ